MGVLSDCCIFVRGKALEERQGGCESTEGEEDGGGGEEVWD